MSHLKDVLHELVHASGLRHLHEKVDQIPEDQKPEETETPEAPEEPSA